MCASRCLAECGVAVGFTIGKTGRVARKRRRGKRNGGRKKNVPRLVFSASPSHRNYHPTGRCYLYPLAPAWQEKKRKILEIGTTGRLFASSPTLHREFTASTAKLRAIPFPNRYFNNLRLHNRGCCFLAFHS